ncbi:hypothetical protein LOAG_10348 [Loa loa]|uniref:Kringle-like domain-containing protein n=2 Tax=Loa loa TaxID=7209 RepID=A0A1S0TQ25_LOALO|nr:hypothetical protein LOAG_10348 [Loa loa]EFO18150.1 hypothetical protein LOAG_10348 [Loa loa]
MRLCDWIVLPILFVKSRSSLYFQPDDMFYVECIPTAYLKDYLYYGNVSTYIRGSLLMTTTPISVTKSTSSLLGQCEVWKNVGSAMTQWAVNNSIENYWIYPDEFMDHNSCRNFDLTLINDNNNRHLAIHMKIIKSNTSATGPWCYAYDPENRTEEDIDSSPTTFTRVFIGSMLTIGSNILFSPSNLRRSFRYNVTVDIELKDEIAETKLRQCRTKVLATADTKPNYNTKLIDAITVNAFNTYEWGPSTYYDSRPSSLLLSAEFEKNRYSIFFAMIAVGTAVMICSISFVVARNYVKIKEKEEEIHGDILDKVQLTAKKSTPVALSALNPAEKLKQEMGTPV